MSNCKLCTKNEVCKFVEKMKNFHKEMYGMFEFDEWNKFEQILMTSDKNCKFYQEKKE